MPNTTWRHHTTAAILTLLLATSCTTPAAPTPTPSPTNTQAPYTLPAPTSTTTAPPTPQPTETFNPDQQAAAETVLEWVRLWEQARSESDSSVDQLAAIMIMPVQATVMTNVADVRNANQVATGNLIAHITGAALPETEETGTAVAVSLCTDASSTDLIDSESGQSVLDPDRPRHIHWEVDVFKETARDHWVIRNFVNTPGKPC